MPAPDLRGFTVAITADRRRDEQAVLLERLGLEVLPYPLLQTEAADNEALRRLTASVAANPPDYLVANTGYGMRTWLSLAAAWELQAPLVEGMGARAAVFVRGAKALGELRKVGLDACYKAPGETLDEVVDRLLQEDLRDKSVVFQLHGASSEEAVARLGAAGANVTQLPVYTMGLAGEHAARELARLIVEGGVDVVTFTAAPQVQVLAMIARGDGKDSNLWEAFNAGGVAAACIGEVCAAAARAEGIRLPLVPEHARLGSLATAVAGYLSARQCTLAGDHGPVLVSGARVELASGENWLDAPAQGALRRLGSYSDGLPVDELPGDGAAVLCVLSRQLDGALEIEQGRARLRLARRGRP
ncbi:MAG TPA: uroporphyrinogen-III synthase [Acidimicrobiales bacterium]|nr:uroporphyrinogen-III synthase [Acidimicrobiales bacterium]